MTDWRTPPQLFDPLNQLIHFQVDAAANESTHLLDQWYGPGSALGEDALSVPLWLSPAWCNPPYGKGIEDWLRKFQEQRDLGNTVVALLPARVETRWWYELVYGVHADIHMLVGRVPFIHPTRTKPTQPDHASALIIYEPNQRGAVNWLDWKRSFHQELT